MLSKTAEYALRVAVCLAQSPDTPAAADELAEVTKIPRRYLHKVVQDLARGGLVRSQPGPGGAVWSSEACALTGYGRLEFLTAR